MKCLRQFIVTLVFLLAAAATSSAFVNGDIDDDGVVRLNDALLILRYFAGTEACNSSCGYPFECPYSIDLPSCSELEYSCMSIQNEFNQNSPYCFLTGAALVLNRSYGLI